MSAQVAVHASADDSVQVMSRSASVASVADEADDAEALGPQGDAVEGQTFTSSGNSEDSENKTVSRHGSRDNGGNQGTLTKTGSGKVARKKHKIPIIEDIPVTKFVGEILYALQFSAGLSWRAVAVVSVSDELSTDLQHLAAKSIVTIWLWALGYGIITGLLVLLLLRYAMDVRSRAGLAPGADPATLGNSIAAMRTRSILNAVTLSTTSGLPFLFASAFNLALEVSVPNTRPWQGGFFAIFFLFTVALYMAMRRVQLPCLSVELDSQLDASLLAGFAWLLSLAWLSSVTVFLNKQDVHNSVNVGYLAYYAFGSALFFVTAMLVLNALKVRGMHGVLVCCSCCCRPRNQPQVELQALEARETPDVEEPADNADQSGVSIDDHESNTHDEAQPVGGESGSVNNQSDVTDHEEVADRSKCKCYSAADGNLAAVNAQELFFKVGVTSTVIAFARLFKVLALTAFTRGGDLSRPLPLDVSALYLLFTLIISTVFSLLLGFLSARFNVGLKQLLATDPKSAALASTISFLMAWQEFLRNQFLTSLDWLAGGAFHAFAGLAWAALWGLSRPGVSTAAKMAAAIGYAILMTIFSVAATVLVGLCTVAKNSAPAEEPTQDKKSSDTED